MSVDSSRQEQFQTEKPDRFKALKRLARGLVCAGVVVVGVSLTGLAMYGEEREIQHLYEQLDTPIPAESKLGKQIGERCIRALEHDTDLDMSNVRSIQGSLAAHQEECKPGVVTHQAIKDAADDFMQRDADTRSELSALETFQLCTMGVGGIATWMATVEAYDSLRS